MQSIETAVIFVGGKGTRLALKFPNVIKPLTPIAGEAFLERLIQNLEKSGIRKIVLVSGFRAEQIADFARQRKKTTSKVIPLAEPEPRGTGGALKFAEEHVSDEKFLVLNGDTFCEGGLTPLLQFDLKAEAALGVVEVDDVSRYGSLTIDVQSNIQAFVEKGQSGPGYVNCGIYLVHRSVFARIPANTNWSMETQVLPHIQPLTAVKLSGQFFDIGLPESYASFNADVQLRELRDAHPSLALMCAHFLVGGRTFCRSPFSKEWFRPLPFFQELGMIETDDPNWSRATEQDLIILSEPSTETLWHLARAGGGPQVIAISEKNIPRELTDVVCKADEFKRAMAIFPDVWKNLQYSFGDFSRFTAKARPALFLDRDGVVIDHVNYISKAVDVSLKNGVVPLLERARSKGYVTVLMTNQSGIGREKFSWADYRKVTDQMKKLLHEQGVDLDFIAESPFYEKSERAFGLLERHFRKPRPGMLKHAARLHGLDLQRSIVVGDRASDLMAGAVAGVQRGYLVDSPELDDELKKWRDWPLAEMCAWHADLQITRRFEEILT